MLGFLVLTAIPSVLFGFNQSVSGRWLRERVQIIFADDCLRPLAFLGGSFYSHYHAAAVFWQTVTLFSRWVYLISGFAGAFYGVA